MHKELNLQGFENLAGTKTLLYKSTIIDYSCGCFCRYANTPKVRNQILPENTWQIFLGN
jgi:hypothetical protein